MNHGTGIYIHEKIYRTVVNHDRMQELLVLPIAIGVTVCLSN